MCLLQAATCWCISVVTPPPCVSIAGSYVLVYFGRNGRGVYGVSESFSVQYGHTAQLAALSLDRAAAAAQLQEQAERRPLLLDAEQAAEAVEDVEQAVEDVEEAVERPFVDADPPPPVVERPRAELGPRVDHLGDLGPMEGRPLVDANPGLGRVSDSADDTQRRQDSGVSPIGEDSKAASSDPTEGVARRRIPDPAAEDHTPEGWEKVDRLGGKEE